MSLGKTATLNSGHKIPLLGYGTWQSAPGEVSIGVFEALKAGYRHLDLAKVYGNQKEVAEGLKKAFKEIPGLKREDIFITSKLWNSQHRPDLVDAALDDCLEELGLDYLDLYLMHFPVSFKPNPSNVGTNLFPLVPGKNEPDGDVEIDDSISISETWTAMTKLPKSKARSIGVSNHTIPHLEALISATGVVPAANQIERHPLLRSDALLAFCKEKNIHITAYSAFGNNVFGLPLLMAAPPVQEVAANLSKKLNRKVSPANVLLAWAQVGGHSVIPKSVTPSRIRENFEEVELSKEEFEAVTGIGKIQVRYNIPYVANVPRWDINIFENEVESKCTHKVVLKK